MNTRVLLLASLLAIAGCASVPGAPPGGAPNEAAWRIRSQQLRKITDWELQGRVGIINGRQGGSGSMQWIQHGRQLTFSFRGPFGAGSLLVRGDADALWVRSSRGDNFISTNPEQDFRERLHIPLPILSMRYWMLGLPDPDGAFTKSVDARGLLVVLMQRGWRVDYQDYASFDGVDLPTRLLISHAAVRIKAAINEWRLWPAGMQGHANQP